jgi:hypothetical protein
MDWVGALGLEQPFLVVVTAGDDVWRGGASCLGTWHQGSDFTRRSTMCGPHASRREAKLAHAGNHEENQQSISDVDIYRPGSKVQVFTSQSTGQQSLQAGRLGSKAWVFTSQSTGQQSAGLYKLVDWAAKCEPLQASRLSSKARAFTSQPTVHGVSMERFPRIPYIFGLAP